MTGSNKSAEPETTSPRESGEDSEDDTEILEESPCGRWSKRRQEVPQRDVPGINAAYLAMDTEEGMEVVWNEVQFSERRALRDREEHIKAAFNNLTELDHSNIVKLHSFWVDSDPDKRRIVFITEYMSSGSLRKFLKLTKRNDKKVHISSWKKWCIQILSALRYLHSCTPPIIHGNLTADTIFIQSNGLIKIGSVAPDAVHKHVKTYKTDIKNLHYIAPEYAVDERLSTAVDVFGLGICALEMAALEIGGNGDSGHNVTPDLINKAIDALDNPQQQDFIRKCLERDPGARPSIRQLLLHPALFEVHSLKLLATHRILNMPNDQYSIEVILQRQYSTEAVVAECRGGKYTLAEVNKTDKLEKFVEDVRYGVYPLTVFEENPEPRPSEEARVSPSSSPHTARREPETVGGVTVDTRVTNMMCNIKTHEDGHQLHLTISLRLDNKMNRQLSCLVTPTDEAITLTDELVMHSFISSVDHANVCRLIEEPLRQARLQGARAPDTSDSVSTRTEDYDDEVGSSSCGAPAGKDCHDSSAGLLDAGKADHGVMNGNASPLHKPNLSTTIVTTTRSDTSTTTQINNTRSVFTPVASQQQPPGVTSSR